MNHYNICRELLGKAYSCTGIDMYTAVSAAWTETLDRFLFYDTN